MTDTSCSTDRLPKNTPILRRSATTLTHRCVTQHDDLLLEVDPELLLHGLVCDSDEIQHVRSSRVIDIDDKVRVLRRDLGSSGAPPFESRRLDETPRLVTRRVLEHAAEATDTVRLRSFALRLDRIG